MLFSVCIPVYNTSKYLDVCLQSVLRQTDTDYEIVLVDDGSTDGSGDLCDRYAAQYPNIRVIHKQNEGLMMTRRRGFQEARGDYLICLDSDDYWISNHVLARIRRMIEDHNCDLILYCYIAGKEKSENDQLITLFDYPDGYVFDSKKELYESLLLRKGFNPICIKAASRKIVDLDVDYSQWKDSMVRSQAEDLLQSLPVLDAANRVGYIKEALYYYRWNSGSISKNVCPEYYYAYRTVYQCTDLYLKKWNFNAEQIHKIMQGRINMIFGVLLAEHHPDHSKWIQILRHVSEDPFFHRLWAHRDSSYICRYYMFMGQRILAKQWTLLQLSKIMVDMLMRMKKSIIKR